MPIELSSIPDLFMGRWYLATVYASLTLALAAAVFSLSRRLKPAITRGIYFIILLPAAIIPILRCPFRVPYIFCRACPSRCVFGEARQFLIPSSIALNMDSQAWCSRHCPLGAIQDRITGLRKRFLPWIRPLSIEGWILQAVRYAFLILTVSAVVMLIADISAMDMFFSGKTGLLSWAVIGSLIMFIFSLFIHRPWCRIFCPIGSVSHLIRKGKTAWKGSYRSYRKDGKKDSC